MTTPRGGAQKIKRVRGILDNADLQRLRDALPDRWRALWDFCQFTGLRVTDALASRADLIRQGRFVVIERKTRKAMAIVLPDDLRAQLLQIAGRRKFVWYTTTQDRRHGRARPVTRQAAYKAITRAAASAGLASIAPHSARKQRALDVWFATGSLEAVQAALNHRYPSTSMLYLVDALQRPAGATPADR